LIPFGEAFFAFTPPERVPLGRAFVAIFAMLRTLPKRSAVERRTEEAAETLNVSRYSIERARVVLREGGPDLVAKVDAGEVKVSTAVKAACLPQAAP
jgi:hypothetical protein